MSSLTIGVELHPHGVRLARVQERAKGIVVQQMAEATFPDGKTLTSLNANALPEAVTTLLDPRQFAGRDTNVIIDHPSISLSCFNLARGYTDELSTSVKWYAEQYVPYPVDQAVIDHVIGDSPYGDQKTIHLLAMQRLVLDKVLELMPPKRIKLARIDGVPYALRRLYELRAVDEERAGPVLILHAIEARGYLLIVHGKQMHVARHVHLGADPIATLCEKARQTCLFHERHHPTESVVAAYATLSTLRIDGCAEALADEIGVAVKRLDPTVSVTLALGRESAVSTDDWVERFGLVVSSACRQTGRIARKPVTIEM